MSIAQTFGETFVAPSRALASAAARSSYVPPLLAATLVALTFAAVLVPRVDFERGVQAQLDKDPAAAQQLSPHDREVAVARAEKLGAIGAYVAALLTPTLRALALALGLWIAFRVAGSAPGFAATLAVVSWALLPLALKTLLSLPALVRLHGIAGPEAEALVPSSLAALLPPTTPAQLASLAGALDLFAVWALALVVLGMERVASVRRGRAAAVVLALCGCYVLLAKVTIPGLLAGR